MRGAQQRGQVDLPTPPDQINGVSNEPRETEGDHCSPTGEHRKPTHGSASQQPRPFETECHAVAR